MLLAERLGRREWERGLRGADVGFWGDVIAVRHFGSLFFRLWTGLASDGVVDLRLVSVLVALYQVVG